MLVLRANCVREVPACGSHAVVVRGNDDYPGRMKVLFSSTRGQGHFQPLLPYARALQEMGHEVRFASPVDLAAATLEAGFGHAPFDHPGDEGLAPIWARMRLLPQEEQGTAFVKECFAGVNAQAAFPGVLESIRTWQPHLIVRESAEFGSLVAAEALGVPHVRVSVHQGAMDELVCSVAAAPIDALRLRAGLDADDGAALHSERVFTSFPQSLDGEQSSDTAPAPFRIRPIQTTSSTTSAGWRPTSPDLPLVYITFGTVLTTVAETQELYRTAVAAVAELPVEALLTTGKGFDRAALGEIPPNVLVEAFVPQAEVFPHASVMVCHGGSGTTLGGLAAGIPLVVVPHTADQPANAKRVATMGAGLALEKPDIATLRAAIQKILGDASFRDTARAVSREMAQLPDVSDAVVAMLALATSESAKSPRAR